MELGFVKTFIYFGFFRALDYSLEIHKKKKPPNESIFLLSGLRAICEDLIYFFAISKWSSKDVIEYTRKTTSYQYRKSIDVQHEFFKTKLKGYCILSQQIYDLRNALKKMNLVSSGKKWLFF